MNVGVIGLPDNDSSILIKRKGSLRGIGKTLTITALAYWQYLAGRKIYSNYYTTFSKKICLADFINMCKENKKLKNFTYLCDEIPTALSSLGESSDRIELYTTFINQIRKRKGDLLYTAPRQNDAQLRIRQNTDVTFTTEKYHDDGTLCSIDRCERNHFIRIFMLKPSYTVLNLELNCEVYGKLYNTDEIVDREEIYAGE
jgi:hypothetical protein